MGIKAELSGFLNHLPAVDGPAERKALLTFTGPAELGIYLDWHGANIAFTERLLEELSRRGKDTLVGFLAGLPVAPQVANSVERQDKLAILRRQVEALDEAGFRAEFPVPLQPSAVQPEPPADPAMLAAATINEVLAPYYKLGAESLRQQAGGRAVALAERMEEKVEEALSGDLAAGALLNIFRQNPEAAQAGLLVVLKTRLTGDPGLASELARLFSSAAEEPERGGLGALVEVSHKIGVVKGDVVGAVVGADVMDRIQKVSVAQTIDTVEEGATVVGTVLGNSGLMQIGGQHHHGNTIDTGGGGYVGGDLQVGSDYIGRDQAIGGDRISGDQISVGDIVGSAGIAIGRGAQATVTQGVSSEALARLFGTIYQTIEARPEDPDIDKQELVETVQKIEKESAKGEEANPNRVERWLKFLADMAPDILEVTAATLANPITGVAAVIRNVAKRASAET